MYTRINKVKAATSLRKFCRHCADQQVKQEVRLSGKEMLIDKNYDLYMCEVGAILVRDARSANFIQSVLVKYGGVIHSGSPILTEEWMRRIRKTSFVLTMNIPQGVGWNYIDYEEAYVCAQDTDNRFMVLDTNDWIARRND